jgi:hypothetical protein
VTVEQAIPYSIGILVPVMGVLDFLIRRWFHRHRDNDIRELSEQIVSLELDNAKLRTDVEGATTQIVSLTTERDEARAKTEKLSTENSGYTPTRLHQLEIQKP